MAAFDLKSVIRRKDKIWGQRAPWTSIYQEAYDFAVPMRRPGGAGKLKYADKLFDMTAPMSAMYFAGNLQRSLFPAGQPAFVLETGPLAAMKLSAPDRKQLDRILYETSTLIHPFFLAGDWDTAVHEMCVDLSVGTGAILPVKGTPDKPVMFCAIPFDQLAIGVDAFGRVNYVSWKQQIEYEQLVGAFPDGDFPDDVREKAKSNASDETTLYQDFYADSLPGGGWHFVAYVDKSAVPIRHERYRTQPIAVPRYYRVPGEAYGRGVILTALPTIKTLNKVQELALKTAAISMLGIWAYRSGGTFNPNNVRMGPGEFWAMQSTGGMMGPDVSRLDTPGNMNVANVLVGDLQSQIKQATFDNRLPEYQGTPRSASEMTGRMQQGANIHIGAFGRLVNEIMPVIVPRVAEILSGFGILPMVANVDDLLIAISVRSPMKAALNADRLNAIANYHDLVANFVGPEKARLYENMDKIMERIGEGLQIDKDLIPDEDQKKKIADEINKERQQQMAAMFAQEAAKQAPKVLGDAAAQDMRAAA
ncbi:portal protein [Agrobacterium vitis]|uniref:portal protein n=1 Tax=Agrobacterium vitis TaxID=373 RepID=UPI0012E6F5AE|nr:portal protein [Agrobacterium vitis]MVA23212.1 hypothetical protein [Agrobacterium vitis]